MSAFEISTFGGWLLKSSAAMTLLFVIAWIGTLLPNSAARRHALWAGAFAASLVYSVALLGPRWTVAALPARSAAQTIRTVELPQAEAELLAEPAGLSKQSDARGRIESVFSDGVSAMAPVLWSAGVLLVLSRVAFGWVWLLRLPKQPVDEQLARELAGNVPVLQCAGVPVPVTWGWLRPQVLLPPRFGEWPLEERRCALRHELAHIERRDWAIQLLSQVACAVFWFHPLAWLAQRRLTIEQEKAADDRVIAHENPAAYATALLGIVDRIHQPSRCLPALPVIRRGTLERRVGALLNPNASRAAAGWSARILAAFLVAFAGICGVLKVTAKEDAPDRGANRPTFVGDWMGGGLFPMQFSFLEDGTYELKSPVGLTNFSRGTWKLEGNLLTYTETEPTAGVSRKRRILQQQPDFFQWQAEGEEGGNVFSYHRVQPPRDRRSHTQRNVVTNFSRTSDLNRGSIAGIVSRKGAPLRNVEVRLEAVAPDGSTRELKITRTDREGRFTFDRLAEGRYRVGREVFWNAQTSQGASPTHSWTHHQLVELGPGQARQVEFAAGRTLRGKLLPPIGIRHEEVSFTAGDFRFLTPATRPQNGPSPVYVLEIKPDGSFEIPDVPPGKYNLFVTVRRDRDPLDSEEYAEVNARNLQVAPGAGAFDLGSFQLELKAARK